MAQTQKSRDVLADLGAYMNDRQRTLPRGKKKLEFLALAIAGEAGEMANVAKKQWRDGKDRSPKLRAELPDLLAYAFMMGTGLGQTPEEVIKRVLIKLRAVERRAGFKKWHGGKHAKLFSAKEKARARKHARRS